MKRNIVFFVGEGRLGNQLIQYAALKKIFGKDVLIFTNTFHDARQVFELDVDVRSFLKTKAAEKVFRRIVLPYFLRPLIKLTKVIGYCREGELSGGDGERWTAANGTPVLSKGIFKHFFLVDGGYYQNFQTLLVPEDFKDLTMKDSLADEAHRVTKAKLGDTTLPNIVVHVRRGDYLGFSTSGVNDICLPVDYYYRAVAEAKKRFVESQSILFVTDDPKWCKERFSELSPFEVVSFNQNIDFFLLCQAQVLIASNSTFSLSAALCSKKIKTVYLPKYWLGWSKQRWVPHDIEVVSQNFSYL